MISIKINYQWRILICLLTIVSGVAIGHADDGSKVLVLNANAGVSKYRIVQEEFVNSIGFPATVVDMKGDKIRKKQVQAIQRLSPDLIYCIGAGAYTAATDKFSDKKIVFSSIINWLRLPLGKNTYGISNELHTRMTLMMYRLIFPDIKRIGVMYSHQYTFQWFEDARRQAEELGINIVGKRVDKSKDVMNTLESFIGNVDACWLIPDPLVMPEKSYLFRILKAADKNKLPVFSYHDAFAGIGASLVVSVDTPTIGRQAAGIGSSLLKNEAPDERIQFPAGSFITLNLEKVKAYGLSYNENALSSVNNIIK